MTGRLGLVAGALAALMLGAGVPLSHGEDGAAFRTKFDKESVPGQPVLVSTRVEKGPVLDGEVEITISGKKHPLKTGDMIVMPANEPHALKALTTFKMLLIMIRS